MPPLYSLGGPGVGLGSGPQNPTPLQIVVEGQPVCVVQSPAVVQRQDTDANAAGGATNDAMTGRAIIDDNPIRLITSRREMPLKSASICFSSKSFAFN